MTTNTTDELGDLTGRIDPKNVIYPQAPDGGNFNHGLDGAPFDRYLERLTPADSTPYMQMPWHTELYYQRMQQVQHAAHSAAASYSPFSQFDPGSYRPLQQHRELPTLQEAYIPKKRLPLLRPKPVSTGTADHKLLPTTGPSNAADASTGFDSFPPHSSITAEQYGLDESSSFVGLHDQSADRVEGERVEGISNVAISTSAPAPEEYIPGCDPMSPTLWQMYQLQDFGLMSNPVSPGAHDTATPALWDNGSSSIQAHGTQPDGMVTWCGNTFHHDLLDQACATKSSLREQIARLMAGQPHSPLDKTQPTAEQESPSAGEPTSRPEPGPESRQGAQVSDPAPNDRPGQTSHGTADGGAVAKTAMSRAARDANFANEPIPGENSPWQLPTVDGQFSQVFLSNSLQSIARPDPKQRSREKARKDSKKSSTVPGEGSYTLPGSVAEEQQEMKRNPSYVPKPRPVQIIFEDPAEEDTTKKKRGRPRLKITEESSTMGKDERRKLQIRLAQRAYRQKKDKDIADMRSKAKEMDHLLDKTASQIRSMYSMFWEKHSEEHPLVVQNILRLNTAAVVGRTQTKERWAVMQHDSKLVEYERREEQEAEMRIAKTEEGGQGAPEGGRQPDTSEVDHSMTAPRPEPMQLDHGVDAIPTAPGPPMLQYLPLAC